jgi:hypothetical protein
VCLLVAIPFLVGAAYFYFAPTMVQTATGPLACQSSFDPPTDAFVLGQCAGINDVFSARSGTLLAIGLLVAALGMGFFGFDARVDERVSEPTSQ